MEPQAERIDLSRWLPELDWIIQCGASGHGAAPFDIAWAAELIRNCRKARIPVFVKQLGTRAISSGARLELEITQVAIGMNGPSTCASGSSRLIRTGSG